MPEGKPKTDEERKQTHKEKYGNEEIPEERKGKAAQALKNKRTPWIEAILIVILLYLLWLFFSGRI